MTRCIHSSEFYPPNCYQYSSARISSLLRSHPPPAVPSVRLSPYRVIPFLPIWFFLSIGVYRASPSNYTFYSVHPNPKHVDMSYRSLPFRCFPIGCAIAQVSPFFRRVTQYRRHLWFTVVPGWTLPADLSDSLSRETPCPSFPIRRGCCFGYSTLKGKVTVWILTT